tara:strand:- start:84 stop:962 length:879 start_codon:yes stop_codon:yes gene_type:complete
MVLAEQMNEKLARRRAAQLTKARERLEQYLPLLLGRFTFFKGAKGRGKTASAVFTSKLLAAKYQRHIVTVGAKMSLLPEFGPHTALNEADFVCQLAGINAVADEIDSLGYQPSEDEVELMLRTHRGCSDKRHDPAYSELDYNNARKLTERLTDKERTHIVGEGVPCYTALNGVVLYKAIVMIDEGHELLGAQTASNPLVRLVCNFIDKMRHFQVTLFVMAPKRTAIAKRARGQVDFVGDCFFDPRARRIRVQFRTPRMWHLNFDPARVWNMYESFNVLGFRGVNLTIADKHL